VASLEELDGPLDFVDVCTPPDSHCHYVLNALERGCHVLCEKPLVAQRAELDRLRAAVRTHAGVLYPAHNYLFSPACRLVAELLRCDLRAREQGVRARFTTIRVGHATGVPEWSPDWRRDPRISGGGILMDHGPHSVYLVCDLLGAVPRRVRCTLRTSPASSFPMTEDEALLDLEFDDAVVDVELSWQGSARSTRYEFWNAAGTVRWDGDVVELRTDRRHETWSTGSGFDDRTHRTWFGPLLAEAREAWLSGDRMSQRLEQAMTTIGVISTAYESAREHGAWLDVGVGVQDHT
jgi:predicted dehydrogenase